MGMSWSFNLKRLMKLLLEVLEVWGLLSGSMLGVVTAHKKGSGRYKMNNGNVLGAGNPMNTRVWGMGRSYYVWRVTEALLGVYKPEALSPPKVLRLKDCKRPAKAQPNPPAFMIPQKPVRL
jgi:hypothetical protein